MSDPSLVAEAVRQALLTPGERARDAAAAYQRWRKRWVAALLDEWLDGGPVELPRVGGAPWVRLLEGGHISLTWYADALAVVRYWPSGVLAEAHGLCIGDSIHASHLRGCERGDSALHALASEIARRGGCPGVRVAPCAGWGG